MKALAPLLLLASLTFSFAEDWPQWMGPHRDGHIAKASWPDKLEGHLKQLWRVDLAPSYSTPIVVGSRVFTTETRDKSHEVVRAFDRATGKELWKAEWEGAMSVPFFAKSNGDWIRSSPACDGERLYVAGMRDLLVCLEVATGREVWRVDFVKALNAKEPDFGFVCSPLIDGEHVFVQAGGGLAKLDKGSGKIIWRVLDDGGGMMGSAFSSPVIAKLAGKRQLVALTRTKLAGVDPGDGKVLWEQPVEAFRGMNILTPVIFGDAVFTAAYGGRSQLFGIEKNGERFRAVERWKYKGQGYMSTPVVVADHVWLHQRSQRVVGLNLRDGAERWVSEKSFGKYWSQVAGGDKILALDERGQLILLRANPEKFEVLDEKKIADKDTWAHLAVSGRDVFIRELRALTVWRWE